MFFCQYLQNHKMVWLGRDLKYDLVLTVPGQGTFHILEYVNLDISVALSVCTFDF